MRFACTLLLTAALLFLATPSIQKQSFRFNYRMKTIVIDAGHGGHDAGCHGATAYEKHVTLAVAKKLGALIEKNMPGTRVVYTRTTDVFVELHERANIANRAGADLFISIHCNANKNTAAFGTESWTMGLHKSEGNLDVAKRENSAILHEKDYLEKYDGFDPNSPEAYIVFSLNQSAFIDQSLLLASKIEEEFKADKRSSRGVKQAGFLVLWRTVMPAVLIETGFLTNKQEEKYLASDAGQNECAHSIYAAVSRYKQKMETSVNGMLNTDDRTLTGNAELAKEAPIAVAQTQTEAKPVTAVGNPGEQPEPTPAVLKSRTTYRIQIAASTKAIDVTSGSFAKIDGLGCVKDDAGTHRVFTKAFPSLDEAKTVRDEMKRIGFNDAFVVEFKDGKRVKAVY